MSILIYTSALYTFSTAPRIIQSQETNFWETVLQDIFPPGKPPSGETVLGDNCPLEKVPSGKTVLQDNRPPGLPPGNPPICIGLTTHLHLSNLPSG